MGISIRNTISAMQAQRRLGESSTSLQRSAERLASGLRINRASDDAAGLSISSQLRVDARVFHQAIRNVNDGISALNVADGAVRSLTTVLDRIEELAIQAANGIYGTQQRSALDREAVALQNEYNRIRETTRFGERALFTDTDTTLSLQAGYGVNGQLLVDLRSGRVGDGTFGAAVSTATEPASYIAPTVGDFNEDGFDDFVSGSQPGGNGRISIHLSNGDGTFRYNGFSPLYSTPRFVLELADFNEDSHADIVSFGANSASFTLLVGNGDGTFKARTSFSVPASVNMLTADVGDFNGDGHVDVFAVDDVGNTAWIFLGNGNGSFTTSASYSTGLDSTVDHSSVVGDTNGDGIPDIIVQNGSGRDYAVLLGNGNGTFRAATTATVQNSILAVSLADLNGDQVNDLVFGITNRGTALALGNGDGTFRVPVTIASFGETPDYVQIDDFNDDGFLDVVSTGDNILVISLGNNDGTFRAAVTYLGGDNGVGIGDFNNDTVLDLAYAETADSSIYVRLGTGIDISVSALHDIDLSTRADALATLEPIEEARTELRTLTSRLGAAMSRLETTLGVLDVASTEYLASAAQISDADVALESSGYLRAQILQQAATAILANAQLEPQLALTLLQ